MTRFILVLVTFFLAFAFNPAFGQDLNSEVKLENPYATFQSNRDESVAGNPYATTDTSDWSMAASQHQVSGDWYAIFGATVGGFRSTHSPDTRGGEGNFGNFEGRVEFLLGATDPDTETGSTLRWYGGVKGVVGGLIYAEENFKQKSLFGAIGFSTTVVHTDGQPGEDGELNLGLFVATAAVMVGYSRHMGETIHDNFELDYDEAWGVRAEGTIQFFGTRHILDHKEYELDDGRKIWGIDALFPALELNAFVFAPVSSDRKDSLVGTTSKGPNQLNGQIAMTLDLFTKQFSFFGSRGQATLGAGGSLRFQERLYSSDNHFRITWDPAPRGRLNIALGERFALSVLGEYVFHQHDKKEQEVVGSLSISIKL